LGLGVPFLLLVLAMVIGRWVLHGPVTGRNLERSVASEAKLPYSSDGCERLAAPRTWRCDISNDSDVETYFVRVKPGSSCWTARRTEREYPGDVPAESGCVYLWQWRWVGG